MGLPLLIQAVKGAIEIQIYVQPGASKSELVGRHGEAIKVRIQAPPIEGRANEAVVEFLAKEFGVAKSAVEIVRGQSSRAKRVRINGLTLEQVPELWRSYLNDFR